MILDAPAAAERQCDILRDHPELHELMGGVAEMFGGAADDPAGRGAYEHTLSRSPITTRRASPAPRSARGSTS
jgi:hypothetical protein